MQLKLDGDTRIRLIYDDSLELGVESTDPMVHFSPLHMLAGSLATCSMAVLLAWSDTIKLSPEGLAIELEWEYAEGPYRVGEYRMRIHWPGLPEKREAVALRVVEQCTVEATLRYPPMLDIRMA